MLDRPDLTPYLLRLTEQYLLIGDMRAEGLNGARPVLLREIAVYLDFYPVDDPALFVDHILSIDREVLHDARVQAGRHR